MDNKKAVEALAFYADPNNWFGAPAPVYADGGKRALDALVATESNGDWWLEDKQGLTQEDIDNLKARLGNNLWDGIIHLGGPNTGTWLPWPGPEGKKVVAILKLFPNRAEWRKHAND